MKPRITNEGVAAQVKALNGKGIVFTRIGIGNGNPAGGGAPTDYKTYTDLINPLYSVGIFEFKVDTGGYVQLTGVFSNENVQSAFQWTEVGIFIRDQDDPTAEVLYAYGHCKLSEDTEVEAKIPAMSTEIYEIILKYHIFVGEYDNISAVMAESSIYATKEELNIHEITMKAELVQATQTTATNNWTGEIDAAGLAIGKMIVYVLSEDTSEANGFSTLELTLSGGDTTGQIRIIGPTGKNTFYPMISAYKARSRLLMLYDGQYWNILSGPPRVFKLTKTITSEDIYGVAFKPTGYIREIGDEDLAEVYLNGLKLNENEYSIVPGVTDFNVNFNPRPTVDDKLEIIVRK